MTDIGVCSLGFQGMSAPRNSAPVSSYTSKVERTLRFAPAQSHPAPADKFILILRLHWPKDAPPALLDRTDDSGSKAGAMSCPPFRHRTKVQLAEQVPSMRLFDANLLLEDCLCISRTILCFPRIRNP